MPNFITKNLTKPTLPFEKDGVRFISYAKGRKVDFILTEAKDEQFFITLKPKELGYVIKGEKLTRPAKVGLLQKSLEVFRDEFCSNILSNAINFSKNSLTKNSSIIKNELQILDLIKESKEVAIEIGFGSGRHLLYRAKNEPNRLFVGIEIYKPSIEQVAKLALKQSIENLVLVNTDARTLLDLVASNLVDTIYLHFPVPWDDSPHRRVISSEFMSEVQRVLKIGGTFELRSDSRSYVDFSLLKFLDMDGAKITIHKNRNLEISSKYEDRWRKQEKDIYDVVVTNSLLSNAKLKFSNLEFPNYNKGLVERNFTHGVQKFSDFFLNFEEIYKFENGDILIKLSFGPFDRPGNYFIKISSNKTEYFICKPLCTNINIKAHEKVKERLDKWQRS